MLFWAACGLCLLLHLPTSTRAVSLPKTGPPACTMKMPSIMYGTAWKKERTAELVAQAVRAGFRGIDTACQPKHYNESLVGLGWTIAAEELGLPRKAFFLQTKYTPIGGQDPANVPYDPAAPLPEQVRQSVAASLRNLKTPYLDSLVLHSPLGTPAENLQVWRAMEGAVDAGHVRDGGLGISNCYELGVLEALLREARIPPRVVQNRFYAETGFDAEIRAFCRDRGVAYQSFWTLTANRDALASAEVAGVAAARGLTPQQAMFAFVAGALGIVPLTGTSSPLHMAQDLEVMALLEGGGGVLDKAACEVLAKALGVPLPLPPLPPPPPPPAPAVESS